MTSTSLPTKMFFCYVHADRKLLEQLKKHLTKLVQFKKIKSFDYYDIMPGASWKEEFRQRLDASQIILLLISPDFIHSMDYFEAEVTHALKRHERGEACVIPVLLRHIDWRTPLLRHLEALPKGEKPITAWNDRNEAFRNVTRSIEEIIEQWDIRAKNSSPLEKPLALVTDINEGDESYLREKLSKILDLKVVPNFYEIEKDDLDRVEILLPFIHSYIGRAEIGSMHRLKLIATRSTGYDHIDIDYTKEREIAVANVPGDGTAVAEYAFGLMLTLSRKLRLSYTRVEQGNYSLHGLRGFDLRGKTLGVVGVGAIGLHVIRIAKGFGMSVIAYDPSENRLSSVVLDFRYVSLDELMRNADIVSIHASASQKTYGLISYDALKLMKKGALLINTARGSIINTEDLARILEEGTLAGVALDVGENEKLFLRNGKQHDNVIITPHNAFNSDEAISRILNTTIENVKSFYERRPLNLVVVPSHFKELFY